MSEPRDPLAGISPERLAWHQGALEGDAAVCGIPQPERPEYPCILNTAYHPLHQDVLAREWALDIDEVLTVAYPPPPRNPDGTVTITTDDAGTLTFPCPEWCDRQYHRDGTAQNDITHTSPDEELLVPVDAGDAVLVRYAFEQRPYITSPPYQDLMVYAELLDGGHHPLDPDGLRDMADAMVDQAMILTTVADRLRQLREAGQ